MDVDCDVTPPPPLALRVVFPTTRPQGMLFMIQAYV